MVPGFFKMLSNFLKKSEQFRLVASGASNTVICRFIYVVPNVRVMSAQNICKARGSVTELNLLSAI